MKTVFQTKEKEPHYSLVEDGENWKRSRIRSSNRDRVVKALEDPDVVAVYRSGSSLYKKLKSGEEIRIAIVA